MKNTWIPLVMLFTALQSWGASHCEVNLTPTFTFPSVETADESGYLTDGAAVTAGNVLAAYRLGVFPWDRVDGRVHWYALHREGVLPLDELHIGKTNRRLLSHNPGRWRVTFNTAFARVLRACMDQQRSYPNWIGEDFFTAWTELHRAGHAYSVEVWNPAGDLVGGFYGTFVDGTVTGESVFHTESDAAKYGVIRFFQHLKAAGFTFVDTQIVKKGGLPIALGARWVSREEFTRMREYARVFHPPSLGPDILPVDMTAAP